MTWAGSRTEQVCISDNHLRAESLSGKSGGGSHFWQMSTWMAQRKNEMVGG